MVRTLSHVRGVGRSATTGQRLEPDVLRLVKAMRLQRSRDRIHQLAKSLKRRGSDASTVSLALVEQPLRATDCIPVSDDEHDLAGFREVACSAKDIMALYIGGAASSTSFLASSTSFVDEVVVVDSTATSPRSAGVEIEHCYPTQHACCSDTSLLGWQRDRGLHETWVHQGVALAAFPDEEFESEIPI